jgi:hypothetical protein
VDTDAHVRAARRRQVEDARTYEREREALLLEQLEEVLAEGSGEELDAALFARMSSEDVTLVRAALGQLEAAGDPEEEDEDGEGWEEEPEDVEGEAERLREEIESSRRTQAALSRYLELLAQPGGS